MQRQGSYLIAYDISDPKQLIKVHKIMKQVGLALQKSLFYLHGTETQIKQLLNKLEPLVKKNDVLTAYPVSNLSEIWTSGHTPISTFPLYYFPN